MSQGSVHILCLYLHRNYTIYFPVKHHKPNGNMQHKNTVRYLAFWSIHSCLPGNYTQVQIGHNLSVSVKIFVFTASSLILQCSQNVDCVTSDYSHHFPSNRLISSLNTLYSIFQRTGHARREEDGWLNRSFSSVILSFMERITNSLDANTTSSFV